MTTIANSNNVNEIFVRLGNNCNLACAYCSQKEHINKQEDTKYNNCIIDYIKTKAIVNENIGNKLIVRFNGSESLLYFTTLQNIVKSLTGYNIEFSMVSNGLLLTKNVVNFINKYNINFGMSNDGPNTELTRGINVLKDKKIVELYKNINNKHIALVLTNYNQNLIDTWEWIVHIIGKAHICTDFLFPSETMPKNMYNFDYEQFDYTLDTIYSKVITNFNNTMSPEFNFFRSGIINYCSLKLGSTDTLMRGSRCKFMKSVEIDTSGNVYACNNIGTKFGNIADSEVQLSNRCLEFKNTKYKICDTCKYKYICNMQCNFMHNNDCFHAVCKLRKLYCDRIISIVDSIIGENI